MEKKERKKEREREREREKRTAGVLAAGEDGELLEGPGHALELEALVVVVAVGVVVAADLGAVLDVLAGGVDGLLDLGGRVVVAAAGGLGAAVEAGGGRDGGREGEEAAGDGELHVGGR